MFKHILLPTDGSKLSDKAVKLGIEFAKKTQARVTAIHVVPEFKIMADEGIAILNPTVKKRFEEEGRARAQKMLDGIAAKARAQGVRCATVSAASDLPYQQIIATAKNKKCDLIMMASHGRHGLSSLLLGSETAKVLTHSKVPVLVVR
ncbi:MAG: universal stress protein [Betaproteobacteria bacterium]|nr:universal stress protein [Betaproteobacteria bacterium]